MAQRMQVVAELKQVLKERQLNYATVAKRLRLSVATIKRLFSTGDFSLERIDEICELAGVELSELLERAQTRTTPANKLTVAQEQEIVSDPALFLVTWLVLNRMQIEDIVRSYRFTEREVLRHLIKLDRLRVIELQPMNRARLLISRHFSWRSGGPVQNYIHQRLLKEFLASRFLETPDEFFFHGGTISEQGLASLKRALQNAARECVEIIERDRHAGTKRSGAAFMLALRPWQYSGFVEFLREES